MKKELSRTEIKKTSRNRARCKKEGYVVLDMSVSAYSEIANC